MASIAAAIVPAVIGAAGSIGGAAISSSGARDAAAAARPHPQRIPLPKWAQAINSINARALALNAGKVAPSFVDYQQSGGTATFPWQDPGMTPAEAYKLGFINKRGKAKNFLPTGEVPLDLTPEQLLFLAAWEKQHGLGGAARKNRREARKESK